MDRRLCIEMLEPRAMLTRIMPDCELIWQTPTHGQWYEDNPTYTDSYDDSGDWEFATPEEKGMSTSALNAAVEDLDDFSRLQSLIVVRDGAIVREQYFDGSDRTDANNIHSASKSIISTLVGIAIEQGYIESVNQPIAEIVPQYFTSYAASDARRDITVEHLLTMTTGLRWQEDSDEYSVGPSDDWAQFILDRGLRRTPGTEFRYSTGNSHLTSAVLTSATGMSTCEFAHVNLFQPLNINAEHWGRDPQAINSGGYNVYLTPREMAKFGQLYLDDGRIDGQQVVPEWYVDAALTTQVTDYGYFWWSFPIAGHEVDVAWGWAGQFIYVVEDFDLVVVTSTDSSGSSDAEPDVEGFLTAIFPSIGQIPDPPENSADFDGSGRVDGFDFLAWQRGFGTSSGAQTSSGDADSDQDVDSDDRVVWEEQFGELAPPPLAAGGSESSLPPALNQVHVETSRSEKLVYAAMSRSASSGFLKQDEIVSRTREAVLQFWQESPRSWIDDLLTDRLLAMSRGSDSMSADAAKPAEEGTVQDFLWEGWRRDSVSEYGFFGREI